MGRISIFQRIFGKAKPPESGVARAEIIGGGNSFAAWSGDAYSNDIYRSAVDAIARNAAKMKGSHIIKYRNHERVEGDCRICLLYTSWRRLQRRYFKLSVLVFRPRFL